MYPNDPQQPAPTMQPAMPPTPPAGQPYVGGYGTPPVTAPQPMQPAMMPSRSGGAKRKLLLGLAVLLVLIAAACGYVFAFYLPNTPANVYNSSLVNSGKALDKLVDYAKQQARANYQSVGLDGVLHVKSSVASFDANLTGAADQKGDANLNVDADILGNRTSLALRTIVAAGNVTPDMYLQVNGVKKYLDANGLGALDSLDGQWISIDHTLIDTYDSSLMKSLGTTGGSVAGATSLPTYDQVQDALVKVQAVNKQYVFTADSSKAILTNQKYLGKAALDGREMDHYKVGYNKDHLSAYVAALSSALDSSKLNDWSKKANNGESLSQIADLSTLQQDAKNASGTYTFELWADTKTKLVYQLAFGDPSDPSSVTTLTQNYTGGSQYPFTLTSSDKTGKGSLGMTLDTKTNKATLTFSFSSGSTDVTGTMTMTPGSTAVKVAAPTGAKPINDVLSALGLGGLSASSASASPLLFAQ